ncbi:hypothetical protein N7535_005727 [Penicillium sp. DV-2018c]|nr:hypothetical protein N7535_005727 [Penicillium sp. DV-2018c]
MAGIVNGPLSLFRKQESPKPLHTRWGDVSISVPTDGSWNQYDNPHRPIKEKSSYGPGYVPDCSPQDRNPHPAKEDDTEEDARSIRSEASTSSRRSSLSIGGLRSARIPISLTSRPKQLRGETKAERAAHSEQTRTEFAYKPIQHDYTSEVVEKSSKHSPRFKYIPTQPVHTPCTAPLRRGSLPETSDQRDRNRGDHRRSTHSNAGSDSSASRRNDGLPPRRKTSPFVAADARRASVSKRMTLAMVPDPDELYE